eukprot:gnl/TRDRNA2_/TRDRNA2_184013_c0_seq1.p1 gnl/TRDRNA2_/TRDRNA2_184013_c0~~gnl/TRDRNA2_/TRDRNA2_184013_c0_seq1.p1  ORF type:complete len:642 (-),score=104.37 gnl/TRDRNA2_/TRDRNA2_184013_c0_seq1:161-2086(-)
MNFAYVGDVPYIHAPPPSTRERPRTPTPGSPTPPYSTPSVASHRWGTPARGSPSPRYRLTPSSPSSPSPRQPMYSSAPVGMLSPRKSPGFVPNMHFPHPPFYNEETLTKHVHAGKLSDKVGTVHSPTAIQLAAQRKGEREQLENGTAPTEVTVGSDGRIRADEGETLQSDVGSSRVDVADVWHQLSEADRTIQQQEAQIEDFRLKSRSWPRNRDRGISPRGGWRGAGKKGGELEDARTPRPSTEDTQTLALEALQREVRNRDVLKEKIHPQCPHAETSTMDNELRDAEAAQERTEHLLQEQIAETAVRDSEIKQLRTERQRALQASTERHSEIAAYVQQNALQDAELKELRFERKSLMEMATVAEHAGEAEMKELQSANKVRDAEIRELRLESRWALQAYKVELESFNERTEQSDSEIKELLVESQRVLEASNEYQQQNLRLGAENLVLEARVAELSASHGEANARPGDLPGVQLSAAQDGEREALRLESQRAMHASSECLQVAFERGAEISALEAQIAELRANELRISEQGAAFEDQKQMKIQTGSSCNNCEPAIVEQRRVARNLEARVGELSESLEEAQEQIRALRAMNRRALEAQAQSNQVCLSLERDVQELRESSAEANAALSEIGQVRPRNRRNYG